MQVSLWGNNPADPACDPTLHGAGDGHWPRINIIEGSVRLLVRFVSPCWYVRYLRGVLSIVQAFSIVSRVFHNV
jgi:hypothetical protein